MEAISFKTAKERADRLLGGAISPSVKVALRTVNAFNAKNERRTADVWSSFAGIAVQCCITTTLNTRLSLKDAEPVQTQLPVARAGRMTQNGKRFPLPSLTKMLEAGPFSDFKRLKPIHVRALEAALRGDSPETVSSRIGLSLRSVRALLESEEGKAYLGRRVRSYETDMKVLLGPALEATRKMLLKEDDASAVRGIRAYTNLLRELKPQKHVHEHTGPDGGPITAELTVRDAKTKLIEKASRIVGPKILELTTRND